MESGRGLGGAGERTRGDKGEGGRRRRGAGALRFRRNFTLGKGGAWEAGKLQSQPWPALGQVPRAEGHVPLWLSLSPHKVEGYGLLSASEDTKLGVQEYSFMNTNVTALGKSSLASHFFY